MSSLKRLSVFGLGKLGACMAATLAQRGFEVLGVDVNPEVVRRINAGEPPVDEPLLAETLSQGRERLRATTDAREAIETDASFYIVPTPSQPDGSFANEFLMRAMQPVARALKESRREGAAHLFVCSSTTTPGACRQVIIPMLEQQIEGVCGEDFGFCYNPEFIALGNVIHGLLEPDLVLIGESDQVSGELLECLYQRYNTNHPKIARMSVTSAELAKISLNSYITMKISFTNQLRMMAEQYPDADVHAILDAVGSDSRVGKKYFRAGLSYGGPCFPRDNRLVSYAARQVGLSAPLAEASDHVNETAKQRIAQQALGSVRPGDTVAVLGMAYRPGTWVTEESAGLHIAQTLKRSGCRVIVHDCAANPGNSPSLLEFESISDPAQLAKEHRLTAVIICCPWPEYETTPLPNGARILDPWGVRS
jgi:UDPglucose 6-dehydrogenase